RMQFVDIAGLVKGAAQGEGLGNQFLANIREVDAVVYVLRCFDDDDITHVAGAIDPTADFEVVETELMLADLESLEKRRVNLEKKVRGQDKEAKATLTLVDRALEALRDGRPARTVDIDGDEKKAWAGLQLLTSKPILFVANVDEDAAADGNDYSKAVEALAGEQGAAAIVISAKIESELAQLSDDEQRDFLETLGLTEPGLNRLIRTGYGLLGLQTYFTAGPKEARAWTIRDGATAPEAAGVIHTDFQKGFIRAETISFEDYASLSGEQGAKEAGKMRLEGKDYIVKDGDVMHFRANT
ncbi:MAG: redox-regulated ATPase YchF, partial [Pseudomonadota bacterium]